ncbi:mannose-P-dolichol utilization defect 1 protein homolog [Dendronephthya gigantea]|uniref:mannose-P-dolichol utilization defect 1 protein homolog n=1 Tax=Dendronephthya gigantea TaxID=151771 RepID=UPI00106C4CFD|nr:mannose-P-dolichol utilization defect 1 protein homolog [Dendronephthya gigantea]XP_028400574.1 mannose-P-dolichol utilization defect 1 protein homolog [Dendronephthya gigantea]
MAAGDFFFTPWVLLLITRECHDKFFLDYNFFDVPCLKLVISKGLGYGVVVGSAMVKVPQIVKILKARSTEGLNILSFYAELLAYTLTLAYNLEKGFPFSTWGETSFMSIQTVIIIMLCYYYNGVITGAILFPIAYSVFVYTLTCGVVPVDIHTKLQFVVMPIVSFSKCLQIYENLRNGHTGQLSGLMVFLLFGGCIARVFTTYHETGDMILLANFLLALVLNGILLFQIAYYPDKHADGKVKKSE